MASQIIVLCNLFGVGVVVLIIAGCGHVPVQAQTTCDPVTEYQCRNGECIPSNWLCDCYDDCPDWADDEFEENCRDGENNKFYCNDNVTCIPAEWECDMWNDCPNGDDEFGCPCAEDNFKCSNTNKCILSSWKCDGDNDCGDWEDENTDCGKCSDTEYYCDRCDGTVDCSVKCDGTVDCSAGTDEKGCPAIGLVRNAEKDNNILAKKLHPKRDGGNTGKATAGSVKGLIDARQQLQQRKMKETLKAARKLYKS